MPQLSVILPVRDAVHTLAAAAKSVLSTAFRDLELILVTNGSDPPTRAVAERLATDFPCMIRLLDEPKPGVSHAFNRGLSAATGSLIARMDADDLVMGERWQWQIGWLQAHPELDWVSGLVAYQPLAGELAQQGFAHYVAWLNRMVSPAQILLNRFAESPIANPSILAYRRCFEQYGSYREGDFPEDYELWLRWMDAGLRPSKVPKTILQWQDHPNRLTRSDARYRADAFFRTKTPFLARWLAQNNPHHPIVWVWGAGKLARRRAQWLSQAGIQIAGYFDLDPRKISRLPHCLHISRIPPAGQIFLLSYITNRGRSEEVRHYLAQRGYQEGRHFLLAG